MGEGKGKGKVHPRRGHEGPEREWTYSSKKKKLRGLSPRANYTDRAAAAGRRS